MSLQHRISVHHSARHAIGLLALLATTVAGAGTVLHVDDDAPGGGDGTTWSTAYRYLQDALAHAAGSGGTVNEIRVAQGNYTPDLDEGGAVTPGDRDATFQLASGVSIMGGYAGIGAENPDDRNPLDYPTTLSGDLNGDDEPGFINIADNSLRIVTITGANDATRLDGFTISGGNADGDGGVISGAGVFIDAGAPTIAQCTFRSNSADEDGGAIHAAGATPLIQECFFEQNHAGFHGGAVNGFVGVISIVGCAFSQNEAHEGGAYSSSHTLTTTTVDDCTFIDNMATFSGGAINAVNGGGVSVLDSVFEGNTCLYVGGAVAQSAGDLAVVSCVFTANTAGIDEFSGASGGAIYCVSATGRIINSAFYGNDAVHTGGAVHSGGTAMDLINCLFSGNTNQGGVGPDAQCGGAVTNFAGAMTAVNCTFVSNEAQNNVGGVCTSNVSATTAIRNCVFRDNSGPAGTTESQQVGYESSAPVPSVRYSLIHAIVPGGDYDSGANTNNIDGDPLFEDPDGGDDLVGTDDDDLHPGPGSPCIDAGDSLDVPPDQDDLDEDGNVAEQTPIDMDGADRFQRDPGTADSGNALGTDPVVDMGCYEFAGSSAPSGMYLDVIAFEQDVTAAGLIEFVSETFEEATLPPPPEEEIMDDPLDENTDNQVFDPGDIAAGFVFQSNVDGAGETGPNPQGAGGLVALIPIPIPYPAVVGANEPTDGFDIIAVIPVPIPQPVVVGLHVADMDNAGTLQISVYDTAENLISQVTVSGEADGAFVGATPISIPGPEQPEIGRINIWSPSGTREGVYEVRLYAPPICTADLNGDGTVDAADLASLLGSWGPCPACPADLNDDDFVNAADLAILLGSWGPCA